MKYRSTRAPLVRFDYASIERAHDVRGIRACACGGILSKEMSIDLDNEWFHGRCFVTLFGFSALVALPREKLNRLTLGDLGPELMRELIGIRFPSEGYGEPK